MNPFAEFLQTPLDPKRVNAIFNVMLTEHERELLVERTQVFRALRDGLSQREVAKKVGCSVVTATRGARVYRKNKVLVDELLEIIDAPTRSR